MKPKKEIWGQCMLKDGQSAYFGQTEKYGSTGAEPDGIRSGSRLIVDDTTIYEVDLDCYECMSSRERREAGLEEI